jgi:hypothetical protein
MDMSVAGKIADVPKISFGKCPCGRDVRYQTREGETFVGSCNKYGRCPTYEELSAAMIRANQLLNAYRMKRAVDGLNGRTWHASKHFEAEALIEELEKPFGELIDRPKRHLQQEGKI